MKHKQHGFATLEIILLVIIIALLGFIAWNFVQQSNGKSDDSSAVSTSSTKSASPSPSTKTVEYGTIKGKASYPSDHLPEDEVVCAENITDKTAKPVCVNVGKTQTINYELKVPVGDYYVYSETNGFMNKMQRAYYNEYVKCGLEYSCPDSGHTQYIKVSVAKDAIVTGIDPGDWYAN